MHKLSRTTARTIAVALALSLSSPAWLRAEDPIEVAGVGIGVTAGNMWFVPIKASTMVMGLAVGAVSFIFSGGDAEMTQQIWQDTTAGPYLITPEVARKSIGERPELAEK